VTHLPVSQPTNSHILVHDFDYVEPATLAEAVELLERHGERARVLAGGTDLIVQMKMERLAPEVLVSIGRIPGLDGIAPEDGGLLLGTRATIAALRRAAPVVMRYPMLAEACAAFSTTQVQVMGTVGGNLCNGSPASDTAPALIAYGAEVEIIGPEGPRRLPLEAFFLGPGKTALRRGELLTAVHLPPPAPGTGGAFLKVSRVAADIAKVNAAVLLVRDGDRVADARLVFGAVAPTPLRARKAEAVLVGQRLGEDVVAEAARIASEEASPIDDVRSTAWYRREAVRVLAHDGLLRAWERAAQPARGTGNGSGADASSTPRASRETFSLPRSTPHEIEVIVNGVRRRLWVRPNDLLLNVVREQLQLTGSKYGCGIGECGACTVLLDGQPVLACLVLAVSAAGREVVTVEGLQGPDGELNPLQQAFIDYAAFQCGFCTPGMLMTATSLLRENPAPTEDEVRDYLKGNLCRCTGYASIVRAVMSVGSAAER
jgi:xanthine dehydrogenase iron-sulfur cluster and FAD-binding subunit A